MDWFCNACILTARISGFCGFSNILSFIYSPQEFLGTISVYWTTLLEQVGGKVPCTRTPWQHWLKKCNITRHVLQPNNFFPLLCREFKLKRLLIIILFLILFRAHIFTARLEICINSLIFVTVILLLFWPCSVSMPIHVKNQLSHNVFANA